MCDKENEFDHCVVHLQDVGKAEFLACELVFFVRGAEELDSMYGLYLCLGRGGMVETIYADVETREKDAELLSRILKHNS